MTSIPSIEASNSNNRLSAYKRQMNSVHKLMEITSRIDQLEQSAEWITRETVHSDNSVSQASTLISVLAEDVRERVMQLVKEFEGFQELHFQ